MEVEGKYLDVTECNFEEILNREKTFEIRNINTGIKKGDEVLLSECEESTGERTHRYLTVKIGETQTIGDKLIMSIILLEYIDEKGFVLRGMPKVNFKLINN